jgi:hypothetical protein
MIRHIISKRMPTQINKQVNQFLQEVGAMLEGFPTIILVVLAPLAGSLSAAIVAMLIGEANTPKEVLGQFVAGYLAGAFCSPLSGGLFGGGVGLLGDEGVLEKETK